MEPTEDRPRTLRHRAAVLVAVIGLVSACVASLGPAEKVRTTYSWPPAALPSGTPARAWYTPLLLAAQTPQMLSATIPCRRAPSLRDAAAPATVLATARSPERANSFVVTRSDEALTFRVGSTVLTTVPVPDKSASRCSYRITVEDGRWSLSGGANHLSVDGDLGYMPVVTSLFSELDLRAGAAPSASITTGTHATKTTTRQSAGWIVALLASITALALVAIRQVRADPWTILRTAVSSAARSIRAVDSVIGGSLLVWWVLSPAFFDDGWVIVRQRGFDTSRGFSAYYNGIGTNLPNGYWLEWLQHWITQSFETLLILRIPALFCLVVTWALCRWILGRALPVGSSTRGLPEWTLATAFLAGAMAWGMTLRPEPLIAVLVTGCLACTVSFYRRTGAGPLALLALLVPLAATGHHSGVVALAPVIAVAPQVARWARKAKTAAVAITVSAFALLITFAFVGSDVGQRVADAKATRLYGGVSETWRDEATRYDLLSVTVFATPLRRGWVAIMGLAVLAFVFRRRRERTALDLPAASLGISLVLLIATPSKWPWHFGALVGLAAVAVAAETIRLRQDAAKANGWDARPFVVTGAAVLGLVWAAGLREPWNRDDLRSLNWGWSPSTRFSVAFGVGFGLLLLIGAVAASRYKRRPITDAPWYLATSAGLVVMLPLIAFTVGVLAIDAAKTDGWTLTRQNLQTFSGNAGCGIGDELLVPAMGSVRPLASLNAAVRRAPPWLPPLPVEGVPRFALGSSPANERETPWYELSSDHRRMGLFVSGSADLLALEWGVRTPAGVQRRQEGSRQPRSALRRRRDSLELRLSLGAPRATGRSRRCSCRVRGQR